MRDGGGGVVEPCASAMLIVGCSAKIIATVGVFFVIT